MRNENVSGWIAVAGAAVVSLLAGGLPAMAQEGYPLTGTWYGSFGAGNERHDLTVVMDWDGNTVSGIIHPGPNQIPIKAAVMTIKPGVPAAEGQNSTTGTPPEFFVRFEVDAPNASGGIDSFVFEGQIFNPVAGNRRIRGEWVCAGDRGSFEIRRL